MTTFYATVRYLPTDITHAVPCASDSGPGDGSLYGFLTLCGRRLDDMTDWREEERTAVCCRRCILIAVSRVPGSTP